jgi:hypothetical protein
MITNERPPLNSNRDRVQEDTLKYGQVEIGASSFVFMLKANQRGMFLRITEKSPNAFGSLIIPDSGLIEFKRLLERMAASASKKTGLVMREELLVERKRYELSLEQDRIGRFLSLTEISKEATNGLVIPVNGLNAFLGLLDEMVTAATKPEQKAWTPSIEQTLIVEHLNFQRKSFTLQLKKNSMGQFLRVIEEKDERVNSIIIPAEGLEEFKNLVVAMVELSKKQGD